jgi:hypothetical protein
MKARKTLFNSWIKTIKNLARNKFTIHAKNTDKILWNTNSSDYKRNLVFMLWKNILSHFFPTLLISVYCKTAANTRPLPFLPQVWDLSKTQDELLKSAYCLEPKK